MPRVKAITKWVVFFWPCRKKPNIGLFRRWARCEGTSTGGRRRCGQDLLLFLALARDLVHEHSKEDDGTHDRKVQRTRDAQQDNQILEHLNEGRADDNAQD